MLHLILKWRLRCLNEDHLVDPLSSCLIIYRSMNAICGNGCEWGLLSSMYVNSKYHKCHICCKPSKIHGGLMDFCLMHFFMSTMVLLISQNILLLHWDCCENKVPYSYSCPFSCRQGICCGMAWMPKLKKLLSEEHRGTPKKTWWACMFLAWQTNRLLLRCIRSFYCAKNTLPTIISFLCKDSVEGFLLRWLGYSGYGWRWIRSVRIMSDSNPIQFFNSVLILDSDPI